MIAAELGPEVHGLALGPRVWGLRHNDVPLLASKGAVSVCPLSAARTGGKRLIESGISRAILRERIANHR